jgi:hypothetical protein
VVAWMVYKRTRHAGIEDAPQEPPVPPLPASDFTGYRSVHQAPPPEPSRHPAYAQQGPLLEPVVPATPLIEKTPQMKLADEMAVREGRVLKALSSLPRGLPSSLWGLDMDVLASRVASGERRESPDGEMLVKINNRWYFGDEDNPGLFMQEYRK